jgi:hypothetical protein
MRKILCAILFVAFITLLSFPAQAQERRRGGPMGDMFQGQPPPPGAVTVLGRSFFGALENGFGNSLAVLIGADDRNVREALGLTDTDVAAIQLVRAQMLLNAPEFATRFQTMTEDKQQGLQDDLIRYMGRANTMLNNALGAERMETVETFIFQTLGGLDSPLIGLSSMGALNLSDDQRKQMQSVFDEVRDERVAQMETVLAMAERVIAAGGPQNLSQEERDEMEKAGRELEAKSFDTAKILAERLRQHLTPEQLTLEKDLVASRPAFLPPLPRQMREEGATEENNTESNTPGGNVPELDADSWKPGQGLPVPIQERTTGSFPRPTEQ